MRFSIKVIPNASRSSVVGLVDGRLKVKVTAVPENGKANTEVIKLLANTFDIQKRAVRIVSGHTHSIKVVEIDGLSEASLDAYRT